MWGALNKTRFIENGSYTGLAREMISSNPIGPTSWKRFLCTEIDEVSIRNYTEFKDQLKFLKAVNA